LAENLNVPDAISPTTRPSMTSLMPRERRSVEKRPSESIANGTP
jgi:hypothetical protein